jgi:transposase-like protein
MAELRTLYPNDLLDNAQAAAYAGVAQSTIRQWVRRGLLTASIPGQGKGVRTLYAKPDLDAVKQKLAEAEAAREAAHRAA